MTGSEFLELIKMIDMPSQTITKDFAEKKYVHGLDGLANLLNCSRTTAQAIKNSGKIDEAIYQTGRKIVVDPEKALELMRTKI